MDHAVDKDLLLLVQDEVRSLIKDYRTIDSQLNLQNRQVSKVDENAPFLKGQDKCKETKLEEHDEHLDELEEKLQEASENRRKEIRKVLKRLVTFEAQISMSLEVVEEGPAKTDDMVGEIKLSQTKKVYEVEEECHTQPAAEVELLEETRDETAEKIEELD